MLSADIQLISDITVTLIQGMGGDHMVVAAAKEVARCVLPVGIYSSCWVTCNPRSLMAFLSLRIHNPDAKYISYPQAEIEEAALACEKLLSQAWPLTYKAFCENGRVGP